jgi:YgiT-type zinc finger domain-containing protein
MKMEFKVCPLCGSSAIKKKRGSYALNIKGELVLTPVVQYWECPNCDEAFFDRQANMQIDEALLSGRKRRLKGRTQQRLQTKAQPFS